MTTLLTSIVTAATIALSVATSPPGPTFHCHPAGGSCVAVEPGQASPYPMATKPRRHAWVFFHRLDKVRVYSAFTDARSCGTARGFSSRPTSCHELSAAVVLRRIR